MKRIRKIGTPMVVVRHEPRLPKFARRRETPMDAWVILETDGQKYGEVRVVMRPEDALAFPVGLLVRVTLEPAQELPPHDKFLYPYEEARD